MTCGYINFKYDFNQCNGKDYFVLEELFEIEFKKSDFYKSALYLIASAKEGNSDNLDYILKIDKEIIKYFKENNIDKLIEIHKKIVNKLKKQKKRINAYQNLEIRLPNGKETIKFGSFDSKN